MSESLKKIPKLPGIYVFKNKEGTIIYIGKAKNLYKRVASYFNRQNDDWKIQELIKEHNLIEHIITKSEVEALLLEAQLIQKFKPKYNVLLKAGNPFIYIIITDGDFPELILSPKKKKTGTHFGPFLYKQKVRFVYQYLLRTLSLTLCKTKIDQGCLDYHLGRCAGNCLKNFDLSSYRTRIEIARNLLSGNFDSCKQLLQDQIKLHNKNLEFEKSKHLNEYLQNLETIFATLQTRFSETKYSKDIAVVATPIQYKIQKPLEALKELQVLLELENTPKSIDCFDISHFQGSFIVGSCIRFTHGVPDKNNFRRFKIKTLDNQNDYAALREIVQRRYRDPADLPDIIVIDGGIGQLNAVKHLFKATFTSLAKREELLFIPNRLEPVKLDLKTNYGQLIIALRDYAHHFAVSYHKNLRSKNFTK